jgi:hypothetical protein
VRHRLLRVERRRASKRVLGLLGRAFFVVVLRRDAETATESCPRGRKGGILVDRALEEHARLRQAIEIASELHRAEKGLEGDGTGRHVAA